ncbi:hypothetical protein Tco_1079332, partial [Tanacetum coccineum]
DFPDCEDSRACIFIKSFTSSASFWESRTDISQKDEKPSKKRQNRTRDGKVCEDEAKSKSRADYANLGNFIYKRKKGEKENEKKKDVEGLFLVILFSIHNDGMEILPSVIIKIALCGRIHKDGDGDALFQLKSDSLPHAHAQTTKTYYKHQDSRIMKAQELKTKTSAQTLIYKIFLQRYQVYQGRLLASFQDDAKYEHVGQDTRSQGGKDDQDERIKI